MHQEITEDDGLEKEMVKIAELMQSIKTNIEKMLAEFGNIKAYYQEDIHMILIRWEKLITDFQHPKKFNISKIPDIFDCAKKGDI